MYLYLCILPRHCILNSMTCFLEYFACLNQAFLTKMWWAGWQTVGEVLGTHPECRSSCFYPREGWQKQEPNNSIRFPSLGTERIPFSVSPRLWLRQDSWWQLPPTLSRLITMVVELCHYSCWFIAKFRMQRLQAENFKVQVFFIDFQADNHSARVFAYSKFHIIKAWIILQWVMDMNAEILEIAFLSFLKHTTEETHSVCSASLLCNQDMAT